MYKINGRNIIIISIIALFLLSNLSLATALDDDQIEHEFNTDSLIFEYNDHNTTIYEGDNGLKGAYANNTLDNATYYFYKDYVRGIAYSTKKSFKFNENIIITRNEHSSNSYADYNILTMKYKNGTKIISLRINDDLTTEQKTYFDDYESQLNEYYQKQHVLSDRSDAVDQMAKLKQDSNYYNSRKHGYYYGSGGSGIFTYK